MEFIPSSHTISSKSILTKYFDIGEYLKKYYWKYLSEPPKGFQYYWKESDLAIKDNSRLFSITTQKGFSKIKGFYSHDMNQIIRYFNIIGQELYDCSR